MFGYRVGRSVCLDGVSVNYQVECLAGKIGQLGTRQPCEGGAENDGHENDGPSKLQGMKLQDMKMQDM